MLEASEISISFSGIKALNAVNLTLKEGEIMAVIGENGAGKSTLMKILSGVYTNYTGTLSVDNQLIKFNSTKDALENGIAIIHQELNLQPYLTISENIFLGSELKNKWGLLDAAKMNLITQDLLQKVGLNFAANTPIQTLTVGQQQLVEIAKTLHRNARFIIMDEPTSALSAKEIEALIAIVLQLKSQGKAIAYISHKLDEIYRIADNYTILRDGKLIETGKLFNIEKQQIIAKMAGRELLASTETKNHQIGGEIFKTVNLRAFNKNDGVNISLKKGEILGIFGLMGAGRTELLEMLFGLRKSEGEFWLNNKAVQINSPTDAIALGLGMVSENRKANGFIPDFSIKSNLSLASLAKLVKYWVINLKKEKSLSKKYVNDLNIKSLSVEQPIKTLSGGNQQKVILAKWLATKPKILLLDEPTRGVDVNAKGEIYKIIKQLAFEGLSIIMVSSELPEILTLSNRILVMKKGIISGEFDKKNASEEQILSMAI